MRQSGLQQLLYILCYMLILVSSILHMAVQAAWPPGHQLVFA
jgi:hypothetical protein